MTAALAALVALVLGGLVWDVFRRALSAQVRRAELAVEVAREAEVSALAARVKALEEGHAHLEREQGSVLAAVTVGRVARR